MYLSETKSGSAHFLPSLLWYSSHKPTSAMHLSNSS